MGKRIKNKYKIYSGRQLQQFLTLILGTFIKYYKISQLIHTQIIAN